jgi:L-threonylcarbamoyladenylate synthase
MYLYPTETLYGLGVNPLDPAAMLALYELKGRDAHKPASWLVPDVAAIEQYAIVSDVARELMEQHLPGPLTVVLPAKPQYVSYSRAADKTLSFRVSSDPIAQTLIERMWEETGAPLTATSANVSGKPTLTSPKEIVAQFATAEKDTSAVTVLDDGLRAGEASTVVRVADTTVTVVRPGAVIL